MSAFCWSAKALRATICCCATADVNAQPIDRKLYERTKRSLAAMEWHGMNAYAKAKTAVITEIKNRAQSVRPQWTNTWTWQYPEACSSAA